MKIDWMLWLVASALTIMLLIQFYQHSNYQYSLTLQQEINHKVSENRQLMNELRERYGSLPVCAQRVSEQQGFIVRMIIHQYLSPDEWSVSFSWGDKGYHQERFRAMTLVQAEKKGLQMKAVLEAAIKGCKQIVSSLPECKILFDD